MLQKEDEKYLNSLGYSQKEIDLINSTKIFITIENDDSETPITNNFAISLLGRQEFLYAYAWAVSHEKTCRIGKNGLNIFFNKLSTNEIKFFS